jgi:hypothetical protein
MVKRGFQNGSISDTDVARLYGRIEREIESICLATGTPFGFIAARIGELLYPLGSQRTQGEMPLLRGDAAASGATVAALEVVEHSHDHAAPRSGTGNHAKRGEKAHSGKVKEHLTAAGKRLGRPLNKLGRPYTNPWDKWTPEEKSKEMKRRRKVALKNKQRQLEGLPKRKKRKRSGESLAKQRFYVARSVARKAGVPESKLPPLPPSPSAVQVQ